MGHACFLFPDRVATHNSGAVHRACLFVKKKWDNNCTICNTDTCRLIEDTTRILRNSEMNMSVQWPLYRERKPLFQTTDYFITSCFYTNCVQFFNLAVMVYFEQPETRKCSINTCEHLLQYVLLQACWVQAKHDITNRYLWTTHLLSHVATELLQWAALNSHYR